ncbi:MAG: hypothetical protein V4555_04695 [Acidobacteriota bacterium]
MRTHSLQPAADVLKSVGWFVPPYVSVGLLETVAQNITQAQGQFTVDDLERVLAFIYTPDRLSSMVVSRYPQIPVVELYQETIAEAILAHFSGLRHVAVGGLIPVVEGIGREMARRRGLKSDGGIKTVFRDLFTQAKDDVVQRRIGATQEIVDMLDAFLHFLKEYFFKDSQLYPLLDKTNRHGILHGAYKDGDYGRPINFYKTISAVDILTFVSMLQTTKMSGFAPDLTAESRTLAERYRQLQQAVTIS